MILLDTHIWYWWVSDSPRLTPRQRELLQSHEADGLGLSVISIWEVAKKNQLGKLELDRPLDQWLDVALSYSGTTVLELSSEILVESVRLPGGFRSDPADEMIAATSSRSRHPLTHR